MDSRCLRDLDHRRNRCFRGLTLFTPFRSDHTYLRHVREAAFGGLYTTRIPLCTAKLGGMSIIFISTCTLAYRITIKACFVALTCLLVSLAQWFSMVACNAIG